MLYRDLVDSGHSKRLIERLRDIRRAHRRTRLLRDDGAREVIEDGRQVVPTPVDDSNGREVRLPHLVEPSGRVLGRIRGRHQDVSPTRDEIRHSIGQRGSSIGMHGRFRLNGIIAEESIPDVLDRRSAYCAIKCLPCVAAYRRWEQSGEDGRVSEMGDLLGPG